jgi:hypothetical protein
MLLKQFVFPVVALPMIAAVGCSNPGVEIGAKADLKLDQPIPIQLAQPIEVRISGLAVDYTGTFVTEQLYNMVQIGSSSEYARAIYGKPDEESTLKDGSAVWKYHYRPTSSQGSIFSLLGKKDDEPKPEHIVTLVFIKEDKVSGKWRG